MIQKLLLLIVGVVTSAAHALPEVVVDRPGIRIDQSSRIVIEPGTVLADSDGNGVIHITADDITVEFADGSVLRGAPEGTPWDELTGTGVRLDGHTNVTLRGFKVHGYKVGVHASNADGLVFEDADLSDNYRKRLGSTPIAEDTSDWMSPHRNDNNEWINLYGGALYVQNSEDVTVRRVYIRRGQNGILFSEVENSRIYDNDASFLTGWGIGLWRSSNNVITRNAVDFCVRGHVEGVYNRGQDSAGILFFEQCNNNIVAENSATHGGDGFFGFGGREALGEATPRDPDFDHTRKGVNDNLFIENDFSYAPAHGWEMTFSFGNKFVRNRVVENAICGVWGGYSQQTLIAENLFQGNGGMPYGLERGGVNIEHSKDNVIVNNDFINNRAGVHIWWRPPGQIARLPWGRANHDGVVNNVIAGNRFVINDEPQPFVNFRDNERMVVLHLRDYEEGNVRQTYFFDNELELTGQRARLFDVKEGIEVIESGTMPEYTIPDDYPVYGQTRPVGQRRHLSGRDKIIMDEWGPWDHEQPLVRVHQKTSGGHVYDVFGVPGTLSASADNHNVTVTVEPGPIDDSHQVRITAGGGVHPYRVSISGEDFSHEISGTITSIQWLGRVFSWKDRADPREDYDAWKELARGRGSLPFRADTLALRYGWRGPRDMGLSDAISQSDIGNDYFGMEAIGRVRLDAGRWRIRTLSDDGVRVYVATDETGYERKIDQWRHQQPTHGRAEFTLEEPGPVVFRVLHFEIEGYAVLTFDLEAVD